MDEIINNIIAILQSTECTSSNAMELDGLKRCLSELKEKGVTVRTLTTDRHPQVEAVFKKQTEITHYFDTWHVVKGNYSILLHLPM